MFGRTLLLRRAAGAAAAGALALALASCDQSPLSVPYDPTAVVWTRLTDTTVVEPYYPEWRGDTILFEYFQYFFLPSGDFFRSEIHLATMATDGSDPVLLTDPGSSSDLFPRWVTDDLVVYISNKSGSGTTSYNLWYRDMATGVTRWFTTFPEAEWSPAPRPGKPSIAYNEGPEPLNGRITLLPDTAQVPLIRVYLTPDTMLAGEPDWDPAGNRLCFSALASDGSRHIWLMEVSDTVVTSMKALTSGEVEDMSPRFSPDGTKILFSSNRDGRSGVWWVSPQGESSGLERIAFEDKGAKIYSPSWSPDGKQILLSSNGRGRRAIWLLSNLGF